MMKRQRIEDLATYNTKRCKTTLCTHRVFLMGICLRCGLKADEESALFSSYASSAPLDYVVKGMRLSKDTIAQVKFNNTTNILAQRKLFLVLDLDQTLIHTIKVPKHDPDVGRAFLQQSENSLKGELFHLSLKKKFTKLRPYARNFVEEANKIFNLYIYTRGKRHYANAIASLLDPEGIYFGSRVIAREDCTRAYQKGLDVVMAQESAVLILDDEKMVWPDHQENLIHIEKYYFSPKFGENDECDGTLASVLELLKKTHTKFFLEYDRAKTLDTDVREVLKVVRDGCEQ